MIENIKLLDLKSEVGEKKKLHRLLKVKKGLGKLDLFDLDILKVATKMKIDH